MFQGFFIVYFLLIISLALNMLQKIVSTSKRCLTLNDSLFESDNEEQYAPNYTLQKNQQFYNRNPQTNHLQKPIISFEHHKTNSYSRDQGMNKANNGMGLSILDKNLYSNIHKLSNNQTETVQTIKKNNEKYSLGQTSNVVKFQSHQSGLRNLNPLLNNPLSNLSISSIRNDNPNFNLNIKTQPFNNTSNENTQLQNIPKNLYEEYLTVINENRQLKRIIFQEYYPLKNNFQHLRKEQKQSQRIISNLEAKVEEIKRQIFYKEKRHQY